MWLISFLVFKTLIEIITLSNVRTIVICPIYFLGVTLPSNLSYFNWIPSTILNILIRLVIYIKITGFLCDVTSFDVIKIRVKKIFLVLNDLKCSGILKLSTWNGLILISFEKQSINAFQAAVQFLGSEKLQICCFWELKLPYQI